jgi:NAD(P)-dependent dehydrogenase (short-subunit alcohol dehydrogenase family)
MMIDLTGRVAVVTGAAGGIGTGICRVLAGQGAAIAVADADGPAAESASNDFAATGAQVASFVADVTDRGSVEGMVAGALERFGRIDILVNNAGVVGAAGWWEREVSSDEDWDAALSVNLRGAVIVSDAVASHMKERRSGKIVNIASMAARRGGKDMPQYYASKAAVLSWTQSLATQLAPFNINVNAICPGLLWTPMWEAIAKARTKAGYEPGWEGLSGREVFDKAVESWIPLGREQTPEEVGKLAAFLASDDASNITGQAINLDGGRYMN